MNTNTMVVGGIIILLAIGGLIFYTSQSMTPSTNATSTAITVNTGDTGQTTPPTQSQADVPTVVTNSSVAPTDTTAVVSGTVTPNGTFTSYWYEYGTTVNFGSKTSKQTIGSGYAAIPAPGYITGLTKDTTYYFRTVGENQYGQVAGTQYAFHTTVNNPPPIGSIPTVRSLPASGISRTTANLAGEVTPNKAAAQYWFEYGKNGTLGNTTALISVGNGSANIPASVAISNLDPATTYYYRINAQNQFGTVNGAILTFKTSGPAVSAAPVVTTQVASPVATTTATLRGTVNPYGIQTKYWFEYSTDLTFESALLKTTPQRSAGADTNTVSVEANVSVLQSGTTYYYRTVAQNSAGIVRGDTLTFKTK